MQYRILEPMGRNDGLWPNAWKLNYRDTQLMLGLERRGLVRQLDREEVAQREGQKIDRRRRQWELTEEGWEALRDKAQPTEPKVDRRRKEWRTQRA